MSDQYYGQLAVDILVVDDTIDSLRLLTDILTQAGYRVRPADRPQLALESALVHPPSLILLDVRMPGMSGFELCRLLKQDERTRAIPVIFVSALQNVEDRVQGLEAGGVDFISKPFEELEVLARVKTHLQLHTMQLYLEELVAERTSELTAANEALQLEFSERERVEETRRESEVRFRATFEQAAVGIAHLATDGRFLRLNQKFCKITGYSLDEMLERSFQDITHPDDLDLDLEHVQQLLDGEAATYTLEKRYIRNDEIIWVNLTVSLVRTIMGDPDYFVAVVEDITERKEADEALQVYQGRLKALAAELTLAEERERRRIAANLHDNVSQSLALARIQLITARKSASKTRQNAMFDEISESLIEAIRDTRSLIFDLSSPLLNELGLSTAVSNWLREQIGLPHDLKTLFFDDDLEKPLAEDVRAILFRNVRELLANVVRHADAQEVEVSLLREGSKIMIIVRDDGIGLNPTEIMRQVRPEGGFGLFSIQERMADLGGSLVIESEPGQGCTVRLTAPLAPVES